jgi:hypothetical protein
LTLAAIEKRPFVGMVVLYYPAHSEGIGGGHRGLPAAVVGVAGDVLDLAVVDLSARWHPRADSELHRLGGRWRKLGNGALEISSWLKSSSQLKHHASRARRIKS